MKAIGPIGIRDLFWAIGFIEGEGSFYASKRSGMLNVTVNQVQQWPLTRMHELLGGSLRIFKPRKSTFLNQKDQWIWQITGPRAAGLIFTIFKYLSPKRKEQVRNALLLWRSHRNFPGYRTTCFKGHEYTPQNTYRSIESGKPRRTCRICNAATERRYRARKRKNDPEWTLRQNAMQRFKYRRRRDEHLALRVMAWGK